MCAISAQPEGGAERVMQAVHLKSICFSDPTHKLRNIPAEGKLIETKVSGRREVHVLQGHPKIKE